MKSRGGKKAIWVLLGIIGVPITVVLIHLIRHQDIPLPDVSDMETRRVPVPEEKNAYPILLQAESLYIEAEEGLLTAFWGEEEVEPLALQQLVDANEPAMKLVFQALKQDGYWHEQIYSYQAYEAGAPEVSRWLSLAKLMRAKAELLRREGQVDESIRYCIGLNQFGLLIGGDGATMIHYLVGTAIASLGLDQTRVLLRETELTEEQLVRLQVSIVSHGKMYEGVKEALRSEFASMRDLMTKLAEDPGYINEISGEEEPSTIEWMKVIPLYYGYIVQPNRTLAIAAEEFRGGFQGLEAPWDTYPEQFYSRDLIDWIEMESAQRMIEPNPTGMLLMSFVMPTLKTSLERAVEHQVERQATRILIALQRYQLAEGELPATLESLVPDYLEQVPVDPFSGKTFQYRREDAVVWSYGTDRIDQDGSMEGFSWNDQLPKEERNCEDQVYSLRKSFEELRGVVLKETE